MVMVYGPGGTAAQEEGLSTPSQLWFIRQLQSQQQIQRMRTLQSAVLIRLALVRAPSQGNRSLVEEGTFAQLQGMLRGDVFSARGVFLGMGLRPPVLLPAGSVAAASAVFPSRFGGCQLLRHDRGLFVLTVIIPVM